jgi:hypothetical protein
MIIPPFGAAIAAAAGRVGAGQGEASVSAIERDGGEGFSNRGVGLWEGRVGGRRRGVKWGSRKNGKVGSSILPGDRSRAALLVQVCVLLLYDKKEKIHFTSLNNSLYPFNILNKI